MTPVHHHQTHAGPVVRALEATGPSGPKEEHVVIPVVHVLKLHNHESASRSNMTAHAGVLQHERRTVILVCATSQEILAVHRTHQRSSTESMHADHSGPTTISTPCNTDVCYFPRLSCCPGFESTVVKGRHSCGPVPVIPEEPYINTCGVDCCPSKGIWGEWSVTVPCNDTCGSCGRQVRSRKCLSLQYGCSCTGQAEENQVCGTAVCLFPRTTCCPGFTKKADPVTKKFICGPLPVVPPFNPEQTTCCDPEKKGLWNEWTEWSTCSSSCGLCGTQARNRTCASAPYGCPCTESTTESKDCGQAACTTAPACCKGYPAVGYDGAKFCQPEPPVQCPGTWTKWMTTTGSTCNDTCGMCGVISSYRYCWPSGCQCTLKIGKIFRDMQLKYLIIVERSNQIKLVDLPSVHSRERLAVLPT
ncbi:thrombospondin type 1 domain protein [Teladorsagia circumcincta]|uniref:Thrombospondin type 1 domain protein n=1 Tax=Teladorsagia circumcincta TaxID=45464 RepID=A0A2G9UIU2_TELCI|nr:thrombospondin type 1 domain protein [Teladorsagia circumcincta]